MTYNVRFDEMGGYDSMTAAYIIEDEKGRIVATFDFADFGQLNCSDVPLAMRTQVHSIVVLFAAAPKLLAALDAMTTLFGPNHEPVETDATPRILDQARAAITKATVGVK